MKPCRYVRKSILINFFPLSWADYLSPVRLAILVGTGAVRRRDAYIEKSSVATPTRVHYLPKGRSVFSGAALSKLA